MADGRLDEFASAHARWHADVEARRTSAHGPLSVTALHWLDATPTRFDGVPGAWSAAPDGTVTLELDPELDAAAALTRDGAPVARRLSIGPLTGIASTTIADGERRIELAARGGGIALRVRDPRSPDLVHYAGTATFPPDPAWVVTARFVAERRDAVPVDSVIPERQQQYDSPGVAEFEVDGEPVRLVLFGGQGDDRYRAIFADATGRDRTYPAARGVDVERVDEHTVRIDFNRTTNPPCAYSAGATCPLPPAGNRLAVRIEAGELRPGLAG